MNLPTKFARSLDAKMLAQLFVPAKPLGAGRPFPLQASVASQQRSRSVVASAKFTQANEFRSLSEEDIEKAIYDCQRTLLDQRIAQKTRKPFQRDQIRRNRHKIAQLKTILREREIEQGITPRESRRIEKKKKLEAGFGQY